MNQFNSIQTKHRKNKSYIDIPDLNPLPSSLPKIEDAITKNEALEILLKNFDTRDKRIETIISNGYPAYTTSAGWLGYSLKKLEILCKKVKKEKKCTKLDKVEKRYKVSL